jgi:hypothetical protein
MWLAFFVVAFIGVCILVVHCTAELHTLDTSTKKFIDLVKKHYEN